ncbi:MAG: hypothetical protein AB7T03_04135 [Bacilli bacterium]
MKVLVTIIDRPLCDQVIKIYEQNGLAYQVEVLGKGTANSELLDYLSLGKKEKTLVLGFALRNEVDNAFPALRKHLEFDKKGAGVAFTIPITSIGKNAMKLLMGEQDV